MQQINAGLLQAVDRFSRRIAFLSIVIDRMVDRILPKTAALAVNCYYCETACFHLDCAEGDKGKIADLYTFLPGCGGGACLYIARTICEYC